MSVVCFENVSKSFSIRLNSSTLKGNFVDWLKRKQFETKEFTVLRDFSMEIDSGETIAIIGPNGTGKSTILKMVAGIYKPDRGNVTVDGKVAALLEVGAGFQPELTGRENVFLYGSILGMSKRVMKDRYRAIVEFSEVQDYIDMPVRTYSSGMYMRLAFSVAIHVDPEILVVDEVLAVGDEHFQQKCLNKIDELRQSGVTILFVSHDMGAVERIANRVVLLVPGGGYSIGSAETQIQSYLSSVIH